MDHVLTVGEIYDKAIDLCLRNAGTIALLLGVYFLFNSTLTVLHTNYGSLVGLFPALHVHLRAAILSGTWITVLIYAVHFTLLPVLSAVLFLQFDQTLRGQPVVLIASFRMPIRRIANVIAAALVCRLIGEIALLAVVIPIAAVFQILKLPVIAVVLIVVLASIVICMVSFLMLGSAIGLARVTLDAGHVLPSMRVGFAAAFSKLGRRRIVGVAAPLITIVIVGTVAFSFAGIEAFALTGSDAANILIRSIGGIIAYSIWAAVATVYYRSLVPVGQAHV